jgi:hypothetical protein
MTDYRKIAYNELLEIFPSQRAMALHFGVSDAAIAKWKTEGVPKSRIPYLMLKYPTFKAWKGLPRGV